MKFDLKEFCRSALPMIVLMTAVLFWVIFQVYPEAKKNQEANEAKQAQKAKPNRSLK